MVLRMLKLFGGGRSSSRVVYGCRNAQELLQHKHSAPRMICKAIGMASEWSGLSGSDGESVEKNNNTESPDESGKDMESGQAFLSGTHMLAIVHDTAVPLWPTRGIDDE